jgi:hypothetical protein
MHGARDVPAVPHGRLPNVDEERTSLVQRDSGRTSAGSGGCRPGPYSRRKVVLASGRESEFYLDMTASMPDPEGSNLLATLVFDRVKHVDFDFEHYVAVTARPASPAAPATLRTSHRGLMSRHFLG